MIRIVFVMLLLISLMSAESVKANSTKACWEMLDPPAPRAVEFPGKMHGEEKHGQGIIVPERSTYPNHVGFNVDACDALRKSGCQTTTLPIIPCISYLQQQINELACKTPNATFAPMTPIACSPSKDSDYCAFVEYRPWEPKGDDDEEKLESLRSGGHWGDMEYGHVPIFAIKNAMDWLLDQKTKVCGSMLLPVPGFDGENGGLEGHVYVLSLDVDHAIRGATFKGGHSMN